MPIFKKNLSFIIVSGLFLFLLLNNNPLLAQNFPLKIKRFTPEDYLARSPMTKLVKDDLGSIRQVNQMKVLKDGLRMFE